MTTEFEKLIQWGGTPVAQCDCGRIHYTASGAFMDEGELARLEANRAKEPKRYIPDTNNDAMSVGLFLGGRYVWGCPCNSLDRLEAWLWENRIEILGYYRAHLTKVQAAADRDAAALSTLNFQPSTAAILAAAP